ncbi:MAG: hypothetical protein KC457_00650, partial [Myxococcales bacterium]|nr:hypothetical protein [Myxococcales bacterium]
MKLDELKQHPAYQALSADERAAVDARLQDWHLDDEAVAATTGGLDQLEAADLRFWLESTASRPWDMINFGEQPEQADAVFEGLLAAAPAVAERPDRAAVVDRARD